MMEPGEMPLRVKVGLKIMGVSIPKDTRDIEEHLDWHIIECGDEGHKIAAPLPVICDWSKD